MFDFWKPKSSAPLFLGEDDKAIMHLGVDTKGRSIWMDSTTLRQHVLLTGSTGAGKTEALLGFMTNAFAWGSGGVYVDGKGDVSLYAKMAMVADYYGRRDDLYVLNFMSGDPGAHLHGGFTHRFNPFAKGGSDALIQLIVSIVEDTDSPLWKARLTAMLTGIIRCLCWRRDHMGERLDAAVIRDNIGLHRLVGIAQGKVFKDTPPEMVRTIRMYLSSLPGYREADGPNQCATTLAQHGYMEMQLTKTLSTMCDVYGHIFTEGESDIDLEDILINRRFLLVMLPALEKSRDEIASLGRIVAASLKMMAGSILGRTVEGAYENVTRRMPTGPDAPPFLCILDEANYYLVDGFDLMAAQCRSLGIGMIFSCQEMSSLFRSSGWIGRTILSSTKTKIAMRGDSWHAEMDEFFSEAEPGRDDVLRYVKNSSRAHGTRRTMPTMRSLVSSFSEGEFALVNSGKMIVGKANYIGLRATRGDNLRLTRLRAIAPAVADLIRLEKEATSKSEKLDGPARMPSRVATLCNAGAGQIGVGGTNLLKAALKAVSETTMEPKAAEIVRIGE